jgi:uncharacterized protein YndB with AHSA1/START domain
MSNPAQANNPLSAKVAEVKKRFAESPHGTLHVVGTLTIAAASPDEVFTFITNLDNDKKWYPGVISSALESGDGGPGTVYQEMVFMFEQQIPVTATVLDVQAPHSFSFTSNGIFTNLTEYRVASAADGKTDFTLESTVEADKGVTQEYFTQYLTLTFQQLLTAMGKTGTLVIHS